MTDASVAEVGERAKAAQAHFAAVDQETADLAVTAAAWSLYRPEHARELAEMAVVDTGIGNVPDKIIKNQRKTLGTLRDLLRVRSVGIIEEDQAHGIVKYAKPVGVVAAITPSTNPAATPVNKAMMALKGRNAIIFAPSPAAHRTTARAVALMQHELGRVGLPEDLVQVLPAPVSKADTDAVMRLADLVVATGSQDNVRRAYMSGTPAIGVGMGNVPVIIDETADLVQAAAKICRSKAFDNASSCSSESALVILDSIYDRAIEALRQVGGYLASPAERGRILGALWVNGALDRRLVAKDVDVFARGCGLSDVATTSRFILVEETGIGPAFPLSGEKLSLVLTVYRARDFDHAIATARAILEHQGRGHSCGLHSTNPARARQLAESLDVVRVLVNQAHTFGNGGSFDNGLNFTLSMGCGTWGGNSISENLSYRHFLNITHLVTTIAPDEPKPEALFAPYLARRGPE